MPKREGGKEESKKDKCYARKKGGNSVVPKREGGRERRKEEHVFS